MSDESNKEELIARLQEEITEAESRITTWQATRKEAIDKLDQVLLSIPVPTANERMQEMLKALQRNAQDRKKRGPAPVDRGRRRGRVR